MKIGNWGFLNGEWWESTLLLSSNLNQVMMRKPFWIRLLVSACAALLCILPVSKMEAAQADPWYDVIYNEKVSFDGIDGRLRVLKLKEQIHLGRNTPPLPEGPASMLKNYALSMKLDKLSDEEFQNLVCPNVKLTTEGMDLMRRARVNHPHLYEEYVRYLLIFEGSDYKYLFPAYASTPDTPADAALAATGLRWHDGEWRMPDPHEAILEVLIRKINLTRPFDLDQLIQK